MLGDRIAIVKEGRLRALGSASFLKQRFGLGYLLRASLQAGTPTEPIVKMMQTRIPSASVVSAAGTELAVRLPKDAASVAQFPDLMQALETPESKRQLGVLSFGIETTTLEEVFMRIVNEDDEAYIASPEKVTKLLGASALERQEYEAAIAKRDNERNPLTEEQVLLLLTRGRDDVGDAFDTSSQSGAGKAPRESVFLTQVRVLLWKRLHQFDRSRGQWSFSFVVPLLLIALSALLLTQIPTDVIGSNPDPTPTIYNSTLPTPVSAASYSDAVSWSAAANLGTVDVVGVDYQDLYNYIETQTAETYRGNSSFEGVYYTSQTNFTVMYNATTALFMPGIVNSLLNAATDTVTNGLLTVVTLCVPLPANEISNQVRALRADMVLDFCLLL